MTVYNSILLQGGLVKHYGSYHGVFNRILKDMGLLDAREDLSRTGVKFPRPKIERVFTSGPGNNLALELPSVLEV